VATSHLIASGPVRSTSASDDADTRPGSATSLLPPGRQSSRQAALPHFLPWCEVIGASTRPTDLRERLEDLSGR
jgi:hypothetical protein